MKHLRETFTDQEMQQLKTAKENIGLNWHQFILLLQKFYLEGIEIYIKGDGAKHYVMQLEEAKPE
jgi:hypothetical protein